MKTKTKTTLSALLACAVVGSAGVAQAGTVGITGTATGTYSLSLYNVASSLPVPGSLLGTSTTNPNNAWSFDFTGGSFSAPGGMLTTGFSYTAISGALVDNGDGTYTGSYSFGFGPAPAVATTTTWDVTQVGTNLSFVTLDGDANGYYGTSFTNIFGTIGPVMDGTAMGSVSAVPVPAAVWLFGSGLLGLAGVARRRKTS